MDLEFPEIVAPAEAPAQAPAAASAQPAAVAAELVDSAAVSDGKVLVNYSRTEAALADLRERFTDAKFDLTTTKGDKAARAARQELVTLRTGLEKKRLELKRPAIEFGKKIDAEAARISGEIEALENPIDAQIKADEKRRADDAAERLRVDNERKAKHTEAIAKIAGMLTGAEDKSAERLAKGIEIVDGLLVTGFEEFQAEAEATRTRVLAALKALHQKALDREAAEKLLAAQKLALDIGSRVTVLIGASSTLIRDELNLLELTSYPEDMDLSVLRAHGAALVSLRAMLAGAEKAEAAEAELAKLRAAQAPAPVPPAPAPEPEAALPTSEGFRDYAGAEQLDAVRVVQERPETAGDAGAAAPAEHHPEAAPIPAPQAAEAVSNTSTSSVPDTRPPISTGALNDLFGPGFTMTAQFINALGFQATDRPAGVKSGVYWRACDVPEICDALTRHIASVRGAA